MANNNPIITALRTYNAASVSAALEALPADALAATQRAVLHTRPGMDALNAVLNRDLSDVLEVLITSHFLTPASRFDVGAAACPVPQVAATAGATACMDKLLQYGFFNAPAQQAAWCTCAALASDATGAALARHASTLEWMVERGCCPAGQEPELVLRSFLDLLGSLSGRVLTPLLRACSNSVPVARLLLNGDVSTDIEPIGGFVVKRCNPRTKEAAVRVLWKNSLLTLATPSIQTLLASPQPSREVSAALIKRLQRYDATVKRAIASVDAIGTSKEDPKLRKTLMNSPHWFRTAGADGVSACMVGLERYGEMVNANVSIPPVLKLVGDVDQLPASQQLPCGDKVTVIAARAKFVARRTVELAEEKAVAEEAAADATAAATKEATTPAQAPPTAPVSAPVSAQPSEDSIPPESSAPPADSDSDDDLPPVRAMPPMSPEAPMSPEEFVDADSDM